MKILALAASNSSRSINRRLLAHAVEVLRAEVMPDAEVTILDLHALEMPIYSADRQRDGGVPEPAKRFRAAIGAADALLFAFAEHNGHPSAAYKNLIDWTSRLRPEDGGAKGVYQGKPMVIIGTSPGAGGARRALASVKSGAPSAGGELRADLFFPNFGTEVDAETGRPVSAEMQAALRGALRTLAG